MSVKLHKRIARSIVFPALVKTGIHKLIGASNHSKRVIINYHGVLPEPNFVINGRHIDSKLFERHLISFKKHFNIVPLSEIYSSYRNNIDPDKPLMAITFDDGYENNYSVALPLLRKHKIPATFFIVTSCVDNPTSVLWPDLFDVTRAISGLKEFEIDHHHFINTGSQLYCEGLKQTVYDYFKLKGEERENIFEAFSKKYQTNDYLTKARNYWKLMDNDQIKEISADSLFEIGSHTHKHYNLSNINIETATSELQKSKSVLENVIGKNVLSIAYPDGSYNSAVNEASEKCGYVNLLAVKFNHPTDITNKNLLPRFSIMNTSTLESNVIQLYIGKSNFWF